MIEKAAQSDIPEIVSLLNKAYRGEASKKGWTTEADMISGSIRTDEPQVKALMERPGAVFLKSSDSNGAIAGCVFLEKRNNKLYLGMLAVDPGLQARGTGSQIMRAAEEYARQSGCTAIFMRVVSLRRELIAWYEKKGYKRTGEIQPFENNAYGTARVPLEFVVMEKLL